MRTKTILLALICILVACLPSRDATSSEATVPRKKLRTDVLGCYALYGERGERVDTTYYNASPVVRLDSADPEGIVASSKGFWRSVVALDTLGRPSGTTRAMLPPTWRADSLTDTVRISFVDGFSGAEFVFSVPLGARDTLRGRALHHTDVGPPHTYSLGVAHAIRISCPS